MKSMIIYEGKYGATEQYAQWLQQELNVTAYRSKQVSREMLSQTETVIIGSSIYIGKLLIGHWLKKHMHQLAGKKIFLFVVCGTAPEETLKLQSYLQGSVPAEILHACRVFYLPGRLVYNNLTWFDRFMLNMGRRLSGDNSSKQASMDYDHVKKENLGVLLREVKPLINELPVQPELI